jgi:hypothetical protein
VLYEAAFEQQREQLENLAKHQARCSTLRPASNCREAERIVWGTPMRPPSAKFCEFTIPMRVSVRPGNM